MSSERTRVKINCFPLSAVSPKIAPIGVIASRVITKIVARVEIAKKDLKLYSAVKTEPFVRTLMQWKI